jgi:site-specific DNA-methyltransferase (adenine-specific)
MYSNEIEMTGLEMIKLDVQNFKPLRDYFEYLQKSLNVSKKAFLDKIGQTADHCFRWGSTQWDLPTEQTYDQLIEMFRIDLLEGFKTYEELRQTYEELRRPFNNFMGLFDIMSFDQEAHITRHYDHDTVKPETLTRALILTCSRPNDLVLVPFAGSGTEHAMAIKEGRRSIAFDIEKKYVDMSNKRAEIHLRTPVLF